MALCPKNLVNAAILAAAIGAVACVNPDHDPTPTSVCLFDYGPGADDEDPLWEEVLEHCNYPAVYAENGGGDLGIFATPDGDDDITDPFRMTVDCENALKGALRLDLDPSDTSYGTGDDGTGGGDTGGEDEVTPAQLASVKRGFLRGIHGLFFHPLVRPQHDLILDLDADADDIPFYFTDWQYEDVSHEHFRDFPGTGQITLDSTHYNREYRDYFCSKVMKVQYKDSDFYAATFNGDTMSLTLALSDLGGGVMEKYSRMRILYHESVHAQPSSGHAYCNGFIEDDLWQIVADNIEYDEDGVAVPGSAPKHCDEDYGNNYTRDSGLFMAAAVGGLVGVVDGRRLIDEEMAIWLARGSCKTLSRQVNPMREKWASEDKTGSTLACDTIAGDGIASIAELIPTEMMRGVESEIKARGGHDAPSGAVLELDRIEGAVEVIRKPFPLQIFEDGGRYDLNWEEDGDESGADTTGDSGADTSGGEDWGRVDDTGSVDSTEG